MGNSPFSNISIFLAPARSLWLSYVRSSKTREATALGPLGTSRVGAPANVVMSDDSRRRYGGSLAGNARKAAPIFWDSASSLRRRVSVSIDSPLEWGRRGETGGTPGPPPHRHAPP